MPSANPQRSSTTTGISASQKAGVIGVKYMKSTEPTACVIKVLASAAVKIEVRGKSAIAAGISQKSEYAHACAPTGVATNNAMHASGAATRSNLYELLVTVF